MRWVQMAGMRGKNVPVASRVHVAETNCSGGTQIRLERTVLRGGSIMLLLGKNQPTDHPRLKNSYRGSVLAR
jgi:hypothetical protein